MGNYTEVQINLSFFKTLQTLLPLKDVEICMSFQSEWALLSCWKDFLPSPGVTVTQSASTTLTALGWKFTSFSFKLTFKHMLVHIKMATGFYWTGICASSFMVSFPYFGQTQSCVIWVWETKIKECDLYCFEVVRGGKPPRPSECIMSHCRFVLGVLLRGHADRVGPTTTHLWANRWFVCDQN